MKRLICVELFEEHEAVNIYTIRFNDENESLLDQFITEFSTAEFESDLAIITYWMDKIGQRGALERYFKPEGHPKVKAIPVPPPSSVLRLYCFRISDNILIIGGGNIKKVKAFQDDKTLFNHVQIVKKVGKKILRYKDRQKVEVNNKVLNGKLAFEIDI